MRRFNSLFHAANISDVTSRRAVLEIWFSEDPADTVFITSHADITLPGGLVSIENALSTAPVVSQKLQSELFHSTNGGGSYVVIDRAGELTDFLRARDAEGKTPAGHVMCLRVGVEGLPFENYEIVSTLQFERLSTDGMSYTLVGIDPQRFPQKADIFSPVSTVLTANIGADDGTIPASNTSKFFTVWHGPSYSTEPNQKVGYIRLKKGDEIEVISYTGKTATSFTGCTRARFGTIARAWEGVDADGASNELEIAEFIYFEIPVAKALYAVLTGNLYGDTGESFPAHWTVDMSERWVDTASFTGLPADVWDPVDDMVGPRCRFEGLDKTNAKDFIYKQLLPLLGYDLVITHLGELSLKKATGTTSDASFAFVMDESNVVKVSPPEYMHNEVQNYLRVDWSYDPFEERYRRTSEFIDAASDAKFTNTDRKTLQLRGMHGNLHTRDFIRREFTDLRDAVSSEPIRVTVECLPALNAVEVGDRGLLNVQHLPDYRGDSNLNRVFQVRRVSVDWLNGAFPTFELFGSTRKAPAVSQDDPDGDLVGYGLPDSFYDVGGVDIETAFPGAVSRSGSLVTLVSDITFEGSTVLDANGDLNPSAVLRVDGDFLVANGVTLSWTGDMILKVKGTRTANGSMVSIGGGGAGGDYRRTYVQQYADPVPIGFLGGRQWTLTIDNYDSGYPYAEPGVNSGPMRGQPGIILDPSTYFVYYASYEDEGRYSYTWNSSTFQTVKTLIAGDPVGRNIWNDPIPGWDAVPVPDLALPSWGLPPTLSGSGGPQGGHIYTFNFGLGSDANPVAHGSSGGAGGGGLLEIARGFFYGVNGYVDVSGADAGTDPESYTWDLGGQWDSETFRAGRGCGGAPGFWVAVVDGVDSAAPIVSGTNFRAYFGDGDSVGSPRVTSVLRKAAPHGYPDALNSQGADKGIPGNNHASATLSSSQVAGSGNRWQSQHHIVFAVPETAIVEETTPEDTTSPLPGSPVLTKSDNVPPSPDGNISTIAVYVPPPVGEGANRYAYSIVEFKKSTDSAWSRVPIVAENETTFERPADGSTYDVRALAVSIYGDVREDGPTSQITLTDIGVNDDFTFDFGFDPITGDFFKVIDNSSSDVVARLSGGGGVAGKVTAGAGSTGYSNFADIPTSLSDINPTEYGAILDDISALELSGGINTYWQASAPVSAEEGDLWYDIDDGNHPYRYTSGSWVDARDSEIAAALAAAATAQTTADGKMVVFTTGPAAPTADGIGDLWVYGGTTRVWSGSSWTLGSDVTSQNTANDTSNVNGVPSEDITADISQALADALAAQATANSKTQIFYAATAPATGMSSGDYWYDADNGNKPYRYNGSSWVLVQDEDISTAISDAAAAQATADGKMTVFTSGPAAPTAEGVGDLWVYGGVIRKWSGSSWDYEADSTSTALNAEVTTTGGVVLSTNGAIRTAGKSSINDGSAGVLLGDVAGDKVMYVGDGDERYVSFDGSELEVGAEVNLKGFAVPNTDDFQISVMYHAPHLYYELNAANSSIDYNDDGASSPGIIFQIDSGFSSGSMVGVTSRAPVRTFGSGELTMNRDFILEGVLRFSSTTGGDRTTVFGFGFWRPTLPLAYFVGVYADSTGVYGLTSNGASSSEVQLIDGAPDYIDAYTVRIWRVGSEVFFSLKQEGVPTVVTGSLTTNLPGASPMTFMMQYGIEANAAVSSTSYTYFYMWRLVVK